MNSKTFWLIFLLGAILRITYINVPPLWYDENFTLLLARLPFGEMITATMGDVHPPLWYIVEWIWIRITGTPDPWAIRLPALCFSLLAMLQFGELLNALSIKPKVQTAAFFMFAVMPFQLWYAQEGRMYALLEFLVLFTLIAAIYEQYPALFAGSLTMLYTQNYAPFYLAAIALVVIIHERKHIEKVNWTIASMASAGVLWLPWLYVIKQQMTDISGRYWIMDKSAGAVLITLYKLFLTAAVPQAFYIASYVVTFGALILGLYAVIRSNHPARLTVVIMAFVPLLIAWAISLVWQPVLLFRPLIGISPFLYLVVCWSFDNESQTTNRSNGLPSVHPSITRQTQ